METGKKNIILSNNDLNRIDADIQDGLAYAVQFYIVNIRHMECTGNYTTFIDIIHNYVEEKKVIFINDAMVENLKIMEEIFHGDDMVTTEEDSFFWKCPVCGVPFSNM